MKKEAKKIVKHRIKWKSMFLFLFFLFLFGYSFYYFWNVPVKNIYIYGTSSLKDYEIIEISGLKEYPKLNKYTKNTLEKNIATLDLVDKVDVKKNIFGKVSIFIEEASVLFFNRNNSTYVLSNGKETIDGNYNGVPFLINYVPSHIYERLIQELGKVKNESLALISEIEYSPSKSGDVVLDDTRFLLRMNDGNQVYINLIHIDRLDLYALFYTTLPENQKGTLELDSNLESGYWRPNENKLGEGKTVE